MTNKDDIVNKVINAMLAMQRYPWEQGVCAQAAFIMASAWKLRELGSYKESRYMQNSDR